jgi:hypothetical protein
LSVQTWICEFYTARLQKEFCQILRTLLNCEKTIWFLWESCSASKAVQFAQKHNKIKSASTFYFEQVYLSFELELYEFWILLWIDWLQRKLYTDFWLTLSALCDAFHVFFDFICSYFDLILLMFWTLNFNFVLCWFESFYADISKTHIFLSMLHTICADMLIICCILFSEAVFLFFKIFDTFVIFNETLKMLYIELFFLAS